LLDAAPTLLLQNCYLRVECTQLALEWIAILAALSFAALVDVLLLAPLYPLLKTPGLLACNGQSWQKFRYV
jgi:hypothetical protein